MTNRKQQEAEAEKEFNKNRNKLQNRKRKTKLIRLSEEHHTRLKWIPVGKHKTMSKRLDHVCKYYFDNNPVYLDEIMIDLPGISNMFCDV